MLFVTVYRQCFLIATSRAIVSLFSGPDMALLMSRTRGACRLHNQGSSSIGRDLLALATALWSGTTALDAAGLWSLEMMCWDPFFCVALGAAGGDGWAIGGHIDWLGFLDGLLASSLLLLELREVGNDPDVVECVADTDGASKEEEVEEDPI